MINQKQQSEMDNEQGEKKGSAYPKVMHVREISKLRAELIANIDAITENLPNLQAILEQTKTEERSAYIAFIEAKEYHLRMKSQAQEANHTYRFAMQRLRKLIKELNQLSHVRIIPEGADQPLPPIPGKVIITQKDIDNANEEWNELMPSYAGMLDNTENKKHK